MSARDHHTSTPAAADAWERHRAVMEENTDTPDVTPDDVRRVRVDLGDWQAAFDASVVDVKAIRSAA